MRCYVINKNGTGKDCENEATQLNSINKPICDECAVVCAELILLMNLAAVRFGERPRYVMKPVISNN